MRESLLRNSGSTGARTRVVRCALLRGWSIAALLGLCMTLAAAATDDLAESAPDFALKSLQGDNLRLSEYRGEVVLLTFWAQWCGSCRRALPEVERIWRDHRESDVRVLGISLDEAAPARAVVGETGISFPVLVDTGHSVSRLYDLKDLPVTVLVDRHGKIRYLHDGYRNGDEAKWSGELAELLAE